MKMFRKPSAIYLLHVNHVLQDGFLKRKLMRMRKNRVKLTE